MTFNMTLRSRKKKEDNKQEVEKEKEEKINVTQVKKSNNKKNKYKKVKKEVDYDDSKYKLSEDDESEYDDNENSSDDFEQENEVKSTTSRKRKSFFKNTDNIKAIKKECDINMENFSDDTPPLSIKVRQKLLQRVILEKKSILMRYFKTGSGEYADGDQFHGVPVPGIRSTLKEFSNIDFESLFWLITSSYHEERMLAALYITELSKKIQREEKKKKSLNNLNSYHWILDNINDSLKKYHCHTIPELIYHFATKKGGIPGERKGWDVEGILSAEKRQIEKRERLGESRPVFLDQTPNDSDNKTILSYQFQTNLGFTDLLKIQKQILFEYYVECMPWIDNWDLVDLTSKDIIGNFLIELEEDQIKDILLNWLTYKVNDKVAGYKKLKNKGNGCSMIKKEEGLKVKEEECNQLLYPSIEDLSLNTLWTKRVAIICTFYFINNLDFRYTIFLIEKLLNFEDEEIHGSERHESISNFNKNKLHDLIEKASGWMLREIGKRDGSSSAKGEKIVLKESKTIDKAKIKSEIEKSMENENENENKNKNKNNNKNKKKKSLIFDLYSNEKQTLIHFLNKYAWKMPRTMLRYSIEKLSITTRSIYLNATEPLE